MKKEELPVIEKPEVFNISFTLNAEIEEIDLNIEKPEIKCFFYSPERILKSCKSEKNKIKKKLKLEGNKNKNYSRSKSKLITSIPLPA